MLVHGYDVEAQLKEIEDKYPEVKFPEFSKAIPDLLNGSYQDIHLHSDYLKPIIDEYKDPTYHDPSENKVNDNTNEEKKEETKDYDQLLQDEIDRTERNIKYGPKCSSRCQGHTMRCSNKNCRRQYCYTHLVDVHQFEHIDMDEVFVGQWTCTMCCDGIMTCVKTVINYLETFKKMQHTQWD
eukprot:201315_1